MLALEKFMNTIGATYSVTLSKEYYFQGKKNCCVKVEVKRDKEWEYIKYHCYSLKNDGSLSFEGGNTVMGVKDGILSYLGMDEEVNDYFTNKARELAKKCLEKTY